ncbi:uncharacterized protein LOC105842604 [Bombyx mori]|uniref:uncharacterized protein LOC105842604 n=1 Tax=Bombyx mori TaxID=7091 RepID=UPI002ED4ACDF
MSIKSQKSLNEECSEIFERSYSVKSASDDSLSCDDEDEELARELMKRMTPAFLSKLRRCFKKTKDKSRERDIDRKIEEVMRTAAAEEGVEFGPPAAAATDPLWLDETSFVKAVNNIFGNHKYATHAHKLFRMLDPLCTGKARWVRLVERLVAAGARSTGRRDAWEPVECSDMVQLKHCKRETIVKLLNVETESTFCYVAVSKGGRVGVYDGALGLLHSYEMFYQRTGHRGRVKNRWVTDALYLTDVQYIMIAASDRSLTMYDASTLSHTALYCITGLPNIPTCLGYSPSRKASDSSELALGNERGQVTRMLFSQPRVQFIYSKTSDAINYYFWMELLSPPHTSHVQISSHRAHRRSVRRVMYTQRDVLVSCSLDNTVSVRIKHVSGKLNDYTFRVHRGVSCFHIVPSLRLVVTGGPDGLVRLWEPTQSAPHATLAAPTAPPVLGVAVLTQLQVVMAYCGNCTIHIWDMYEECLLQSLKINYPFLGVIGKKVEFGTYCVFPGPLRKTEETLGKSASSRRGSSVYPVSGGGLVLVSEADEGKMPDRFEDDPEYAKYSRSEVMVTCCEYACRVRVRPAGSSPLPPPGPARRPRRPSLWDLSRRSPARTPERSPQTLSPRLSTPPEPPGTDHTNKDLDVILKKAGLEGILEKNFVLMQGLKHDLHKKLAELSDRNESMSSAVNIGAPYLALKTYEPSAVERAEDIIEAYKRVLKFIPSSTTITPTASQSSTPRNSKETK